MKWLKRIFTFCLLLVIGFFLFLRFAYKLTYSDEQMHQWVKEINSVHPLPKNYIDIIEKLNPNFYKRGTLAMLFCTKGNCPKPPSIRIVYLQGFYSHHSHSMAEFSKAWYLEKNSTLKQCHAYVLANTIYFPNQVTEIGIFNAAQHLFNKPLHDLNTEECLELYLKAKAPTRYDWKRNPDLLSKKIKQLKEKLN